MSQNPKEIHNFETASVDVDKLSYDELCNIFGKSVAEIIIKSRTEPKEGADLYVKEIDVKNKIIKLGFL